MSNWVWPLPGYVVWEIPRSGMRGSFQELLEDHTYHSGVDLAAPKGAPVHAVESGLVRNVGTLLRNDASFQTICVEGFSGVVCYCEIQVDESITPGTQVEQGQRVGVVKGIWAPNPVLHLEFWQDWASVPHTAANWTSEFSRPEGLLDPTENLLQAWTRVTPRFHRDRLSPPENLETRRELLSWLSLHDIWTYPWTFLAPPDGTVPDDLLDLDCDKSGWVEQSTRWGRMEQCLHFDFVYVDPTIEEIQGFGHWSEDPRNTAFRVWIEAHTWFEADPEAQRHERWDQGHVLNLDCGAESMEDALCDLALRVRFFFGDRDTPRADGPRKCADECRDAGDGFCSACGYLVLYPREVK